MTSDTHIDRLVGALRSAGAPEPQPPADASSLAALERELAPLRLPETLRRLWQRIDVRSLALGTYPQLSAPDFALSGWRMNRDGDLVVPLSMLPFCYESHNHLLIELDDGEETGGTVFEWGFGDGALRIRFAGVEDWLAVLVAALDEGSFERREGVAGLRLVIDFDRFKSLAEERLVASGAHPLYGDVRQLSLDITAWPERWQRASAPFKREQRPRGADKTVRDLLNATRDGDVRATLSGVISTLAIGPDRSWRIALVDPTGVIDVACPPDMPGFGFLGQSPRIELDVRAPHVTGPRGLLDWREALAAQPGERDGEPRLHDLIRHVEPQAIGEAIRPLEPPERS
jgi:hypothetical protein